MNINPLPHRNGCRRLAGVLANIHSLETGLGKLAISAVVAVENTNIGVSFTQELGIHYLSSSRVKAKKSTLGLTNRVKRIDLILCHFLHVLLLCIFSLKSQLKRETFLSPLKAFSEIIGTKSLSIASLITETQSSSHLFFPTNPFMNLKSKQNSTS